MADLSNVVRMLIHQLDATRSYLLPSYCDEDEKARAVIAFAESALAAEPPAPAEPDTDAVLALAAIIRRVDGSNSLGAAALAEAILAHPNAASVFLPPAPAPADHVPGARNMVPADGEREELAQWLEDEAVYYEGLSTEASAKATRAAALLREARPQPVPVPVAVLQRLPEPGDCDTEGRCWVGCAAQIDQTGDFDCEYNASWELSPVHPQDEVWLPHWAIPQPPQANTTHPIPTEPPTND